MATILNNPNCSSNIGNTGLSTCPVDFGFIVGGFFADPAFHLDAADLVTPAALKAKLQSATLAAPGSGRIYPLPRFEEVQDQSTEPKEETLGFGAVQVIMEGKKIHTWRFLKGGMWLNAKLRTFNLKNYNIWYFTDKEVIGQADGAGGATGFSTYQIYTYPVKLNDGSKGNQYRIKVGEQNAAEWDNYAVMLVADGSATGWNPQSSIIGLLDVTIAEASVGGSWSKQIPVTLAATGDQTDLVPVYATELADADAWIVKNALGVAQTPTSVAVNGSTVEINFSGLSAGVFTVSLATPAALAVLGIGGPPTNGYESNILTVTVGS